MSKNSINLLTTVALAVVLSFFLPWWSVMVAAMVTAAGIPLKKAAVFFIPFLVILLFWVTYAFILGNANDFTLAKKIAQLLPLGGNLYLLLLFTGAVGGLAAGVAALFGRQLVALGSKG